MRTVGLIEKETPVIKEEAKEEKKEKKNKK